MFIYQITNSITHDFYIGKTKKDIKLRFKEHLYKARNNIQTHFYRAIRKYGENNFLITLLEETKEQLLNNKEIKWIKKLKPTYNMTKGGEGGLTKIYTKEERLIVSKKYTGKGNPMWGKRGKDNPNFGKKHGPNKKTSDIKKNPCICDGMKFDSIGTAELYFKEKNIPVSVRKRLDSPRYTNWYRLVKKRGLINPA
jgi:group I intron endonuclease